MKKLFSPFTIKEVSIKNRIVLPPMVCFGWSDDSGIVSDNHIKHYEDRARGGAGLIVLEAHCVNKDGRLADTQLGIWSDEHINGLRQMGEVCHRHGSKVIVQIHHAGLKTPESIAPVALSSSDYSKDGRTARALTLEEIHSIQQDYVNAALRAKEAGLDGIELHGAHGYLISQFMSPITNKRQDQYGGSIENRMRFALEILASIKDKVGDSFIIGYRMGGNEPNLEEGIIIAKELEKAGVDLLHVSAGIASEQLPVAPENFPFNWIVYCGTEIKKHVKIPVIVVNGIRTADKAAYVVDNDLADFVAIGKGYLVDKSWGNKAMNNEEVISCLECPRCQWFKNGANCPRNKD